MAYSDDVARIVAQLLALPVDQRESFLLEACLGDEALEDQVLELLSDPEEAQRAAAKIETLPAISPMPLASKLEIPGYQILRSIGEGGMGTVYEAAQSSPKRTVALKVMRLGLDSDNSRRRFELEVEVLGRLHHGGVAQIYETGVAQVGNRELPWFAMEFVDGARAITEYADEQELDRDARLELFARVCDAVHYGHQRGVIHRDLKPENVLVGQDGVPKVIDFGIARATDADVARTRLFTQTGQIVGTIQYMSPEQLEEDGLAIDVRCDVYALGVILYELLTGSHPYEFGDIPLIALVQAIRTRDPRKPSTAAHGLAEDLDLVALKALSKDPDQRYASAESLAADVQRFLNHEPVVARPPSWTYRGRMFARRNPIAASAMALGTVALAVISVLFVGLQAANADLDVALASAEERRHQAEAAALRERLRSEEVLRLSAQQDVARLVRDAEALWPVTPESVDALEQWLAEAEPLIAELEGFRATRTEIAAKASGIDTATGEPTFDDVRDAWWHAQLGELIGALEQLDRMAGPNVVADAGWGLARRLEFARTVVESSLVGQEAAERWSETVDAIAADPRYEGLVLEPQLGLVPLGPDPASGFSEFAHLASGAVPERDDDGVLLMHEGAGIVLVLLPAGAFLMGAQRTSPNQPNYDPFAESQEAPPHEVRVSPFFLSKFELTQAQWQRLTGSNPSKFSPDGMWDEAWAPGGAPVNLMHPVERVSWEECRDMLGRFGLALPTEAQWEYAARGGTQTPWWTGDQRDALAHVANLVETRSSGDGFYMHAPVDSFAPNPFGLHNVLGNVAEWCFDSSSERYASAPVEDPVADEPAPATRVIRGGFYGAGAEVARSASRRGLERFNAFDFLSVRPARAIER